MVQAARKLAEVVEASELAQRTQLLGGDNQPINVAFCFRAPPSRAAAGAEPAGNLSEISDYYRRLQPGRLLITGAPGAGKTVLAVELMLGLLEIREVGEPVPVRMALAGWDTTQPLDRWLSDQLVDTYQLSKATAKRLVERRCILPVLDGLDEMDGGVSVAGPCRAAEALAAFNQYQVGRQKAPLVVTCRTTTYDTLSAGIRLTDSARIVVSSVTAEQAERFVAARALAPDDWQPVLAIARQHPQGAAAHILSTPWLLTLAVTVYEANGHPTELLRFTDPEALRNQLLDQFLPAATKLHERAGNRVYGPEQVGCWLGLLARYLTQNARERRTVGGHVLSSTDLVLHRLWPIAGMRARVADMAVSSTVGLAFVYSMVPAAIDDHRLALGLVVLALLAISWIVASARTVWPTPKSITPGRLRTQEGRRAVIGPVVVGFVAVLAFSLAVTLPNTYSPASDVVLGCSLLFPVALIGGCAFGLRRNLETTASNTGPNALVRADLRSGILVGVSAAAGLVLSIVTWGLLKERGFHPNYYRSLIILLVLLGSGGVLGGVVWAAAWRRYVATLLCTRRRLPWRLGRFLAWASDAGLLRVAGNAYQFRHLELQDHLANAEAAGGNQ
ncbi:NACHT domain-containing protein [Streptomyces cirratus]